LRRLLLVEEYGVTIEYLPGNKYKNVVEDALSRLDIDSLKIQEDEFSQDQKAAASVISYKQSYEYCFDLQRTSKSQGMKIKRKGFILLSLLNIY
jgi:hypothetical protein